MGFLYQYYVYLHLFYSFATKENVLCCCAIFFGSFNNRNSFERGPLVVVIQMMHLK